MGIEEVGLKLPPKLRLARVDARSIGEAMDKSRKNGAGNDELDEMYSWLNKNKSSETAIDWEPTRNFFPNATSGVDEKVPFLAESVGKFVRYSFHRAGRWGGYVRAVLKD